MKKFLSSIALIFLSTLANAQTNYVCAAEQVSGFKLNQSNKIWKQTGFQSDAKFVVKQTSGTWEITRIGEDTLVASCPINKKNSVVACNGGIESFIFNTSTLKFTYFYAGGFAVPVLSPDSVNVAIGACSKF